MASLSTKQNRRRLHVRGMRRQNGVLMPFLAVCVILLMGTAGIVTDMMRNFQAVRELKYAAQSTALYALSLSANASGAYAQSSVQDAVLNPTTAISNNAQIGPGQSNPQWSGPVTYTSSDIAFVQNAADINESILQVTARRQGDSALAQFFLPLLFTGLNSSLPNSIKTFETAQTVEVLGQPATRIGAGAPSSSSSTTGRASDFYGYAALPLAITAQQFASLVNANKGNVAFSAVADLVSSTSPSAKVGHIPAAFINLTATSGGTTCYNGAQGVLAQGQLQSTLSYFSTPASSQASTIPPSWVECGSQVSAFDPADPSFTAGQNQGQIAALVNALPARTYVLPVISGGQPQLAGSKGPALNTVVGFACVQLPKQNLASQPFSISLNFVKAPPLRNASSAAGAASWPAGGGSLMPAPSFPFLPRTYDGTTGGVSPRLPGVALAPALSPRAN